MVGLGSAFATEVERTISLIREHPDAGSMNQHSPTTRTLSSSSRSPINAGILAIGGAEYKTRTHSFTGPSGCLRTRRVF